MTVADDPAPADATALVLPTTASLRFLPSVTNASGAAGALTLRVADTTQAFTSSTDLGTLDQESAWSDTVTLGTTVDPVNDAPEVRNLDATAANTFVEGSGVGRVGNARDPRRRRERLRRRVDGEPRGHVRGRHAYRRPQRRCNRLRPQRGRRARIRRRRHDRRKRRRGERHEGRHLRLRQRAADDHVPRRDHAGTGERRRTSDHLRERFRYAPDVGRSALPVRRRQRERCARRGRQPDRRRRHQRRHHGSQRPPHGHDRPGRLRRDRADRHRSSRNRNHGRRSRCGQRRRPTDRRDRQRARRRGVQRRSHRERRHDRHDDRGRSERQERPDRRHDLRDLGPPARQRRR